MWGREARRRDLGRLETRAGGTFTGVVELVVIPALVAIGTGLIVEAVKMAVAELLPERERETVTVIVQRLPDGTETILVQRSTGA